jgi:uncharacterized oxidoreductase
VTPTYNATKAAIHTLSESLCLQLAGTSVSVVELEPPAVATDLLPGQRESSFAMPLDEFVAEVTALLESQPDATEIQVERVKFLRYGEARGDYDQVWPRSTGSTRTARRSATVDQAEAFSSSRWRCSRAIALVA